jgi:hypothetical protein
VSKLNERGRKWVCWVLAAIMVWQLYFVQELVVLFLVFALGFAAVLLLVAGVYGLVKLWKAVAKRFAHANDAVLNVEAVKD